MSYQTQRQKIREFFMTRVYSQMDVVGIDYDKTIDIIVNDLGVSRTMVEDMINSLIGVGIIKETRILELPEEELKRRKKAKQEIINQELKEAGLETNDNMHLS